MIKSIYEELQSWAQLGPAEREQEWNTLDSIFKKVKSNISNPLDLLRFFAPNIPRPLQIHQIQ